MQEHEEGALDFGQAFSVNDFEKGRRSVMGNENEETGNFALYILQISALVIGNLLQPCQISNFQRREAIRGLKPSQMRL
jgi:hypothetical protein